jgi:hypothetical protein
MLYWKDHYGKSWPVCECLQKWLPAYENELLRRGLIHTCIDLYQTIGNASASASTHSTGGCADLRQVSTEQLRVARNMGAADWKRDADPNDGQPDMSPTHAHLSLCGCPHAHYSAKAQVTSCNNGGNGLAGNGPDDGPRTGVQWPLRTWSAGILWAASQASSPGVDLRPWKITLPVDRNDNGVADERYPIGTWDDPSFFDVVRDATGKVTRIRFRAPVAGATTSGSKYPRSELREMKLDGNKAAWSSTSGSHTMTGLFDFKAVPGRKPHVVCAQIHDASDDIVMVRLEGQRIFVEGDGNDYGTLDGLYTLGDPFYLTVKATSAGVSVKYVSAKTGFTKTRTVSKTGSGWYFKAGCYTQANEDNGTGYGEVNIYELAVSHK